MTPRAVARLWLRVCWPGLLLAALLGGCSLYHPAPPPLPDVRPCYGHPGIRPQVICPGIVAP